MSYSSFLTTEQHDTITQKTYALVLNKGKKAHRQNDDKRPLLTKVFQPIMKTTEFQDGEASYHVRRTSDVTPQSPYGLDELQYTEEHGGERLTFDEGRLWIGTLVIEDELRGMGYKVKPLGVGTGGIRLTKSQVINIVDELADKIIEREEAYLRELDEALHGDGTGTPDIVGIRGLFPVTNTAGTIGGISRAIEAYQHQFVDGLTAGTFGSPGDFASLLEPAIRAADRYSQNGTLNAGVAGGAWMDAWKDYIRNIGTANYSITGSGLVSANPVIDDTAVKIGKFTVHWDPTLDRLGDEEGDATLTKTAYFFNTNQMDFLHAEHMERVDAPANHLQMARRFGMLGRYSICVKQPNAACLVSRVD